MTAHTATFSGGCSASSRSNSGDGGIRPVTKPNSRIRSSMSMYGTTSIAASWRRCMTGSGCFEDMSAKENARFGAQLSSQCGGLFHPTSRAETLAARIIAGAVGRTKSGGE
jgi:hypothetical protein